jgi:M6 family metalloprotease-like protein
MQTTTLDTVENTNVGQKRAAVVTNDCTRPDTNEILTDAYVAQPNYNYSSLCMVAPPEAAPVKGRLNRWAAVDGLATAVMCRAGDNLEITVSAEIYQATGSVWMRAVVDGIVAQPSDVQFKTGNLEFDGVRSFTFVQPNMSKGQHLVEIQMNSGSEFSIRDRVLTVSSIGNLTAVAASGPPIPCPAQFQDIPGLSTTVPGEVHHALAIIFSAEAWANSGRMEVRALVGDTVVGEVIFAEAGNPERRGTRSFTFVTPSLDLPAGSRIRMQWRCGSGSATIGDRTISVSPSLSSTSTSLMFAVNPSAAVSLTQTEWVDLFEPATFETTFNLNNVLINASTEVLANPGRVFLRVLVDGQPASPSDITLIQGGSKWRATGHTFVLKNVGYGRHEVRVQARVDPHTTAKYRRRTLRISWGIRYAPDFVQPFLRMSPVIKRIRLLVIGFDPVRPGHPRPSFAQIRKTFEGDQSHTPEANLRQWLIENSAGNVTLSEVRYVGCQDGQWFVAPPERQGNWYWDNLAFEQMWKDALAAADAEVDFHSFDIDKNNRLSSDELVVAIVRPQAVPYGTVRGTDATLDGAAIPLNVPVLDLYLSSNPQYHRWGVGLVAHEFTHHVLGTLDLYNGCPAISPGPYSIMDRHDLATHLDPFEKMKNGLVRPYAENVNELGNESTWDLPAIEYGQEVLLLHEPSRAAREYFLIENRYPGDIGARNYDDPLGNGAIVVWQIFEDLQLVHTSTPCQGDPRFIRKRAVLSAPTDTFDLTWSDGSPVGRRLTAPNPNARVARLIIKKI